MMDTLVRAQRDEITSYVIYRELAKRERGRNRETLERLANDELKHYEILREITGIDVEVDVTRKNLVLALARMFGTAFAVKWMERSEVDAQDLYRKLSVEYPQLSEVLEDEERHERELRDMIEDVISSKIGSIVLGFNDALVEMTGSLAGLTLALQNNTLISISSLVVGVSASLSMAASEFLSRRAEGDEEALSRAIYTGLTYFVVVLLLVSPFFIFNEPFKSLLVTLLFSVVLVALTSYYVSVLRERDYKEELVTMLVLSLGVALISFAVGYLLRQALGVEA